MSNEHAIATSDTPDEVNLRVIVVPLLLSAVLVAVVLLYRCRSHRLRRDRLAEEHEEELQEIAGEHSIRCYGMRGFCSARLFENNYKLSTAEYTPNICSGLAPVTAAVSQGSAPWL